MSKKTIVQILRAPAGGIRKHVVDILVSLENENCEQIFITNTRDADIDLGILKSIRNLQIIHLDIVDSPGLADLKNAFAIAQILRGKKNLILHGHGAKGGLYARLVSRIIRAQAFYTPHGGSLHRVFGKIKNTIYDLVEKVLIHFTDLFIFESQYTANLFLQNIAQIKNYQINYNGIDFNEVAPSLVYHKGDVLYMASFGLLRELKGHAIMINTCGLLKKQGVKFKYDIFGTGELETDLKKQIEDLNLKDDVRLMGYSLNVPADMKNYHLIIQPSLFESFGYVPLEAMALKIPVLVSSNGGLREVVPSPQYGFIANSNEAQEYFQIVQAIYLGQENLSEKTNAAYLFAKNKFSRETMILNLKKYYGI